MICIDYINYRIVVINLTNIKRVLFDKAIKIEE